MFRRLTAFWSAPEGNPQGRLFAAYATIGVLCILAGVVFQAWWLMGLPIGLAVMGLALVDFRKIFFLMLACIPISMEKALPGGFATDLPSEQLMWLLTIVGCLWFLQNWRSVDARFIRHPLSLALFAHLAWMTVCVVTSQDVYVSFKYMLAKGWYVVVFYFMAGRLLNTERDFKDLLWWFFVPLLFATCVIIVRHAAIGFSFKDVEYVMGPFFRGHVMYACSLAIFLPFLWYGTYWYRRYSFPWFFLIFGILVFLFGINFAYTRAAYVALVAAVGIYWVIRFRMMKVVLVVTLLVATIFVQVITTRDNWLQFAPDYERTVTSARFESLLTATTRLEDISTMERVYRWVAASYMIEQKPMTGFGPGTFYFYYKNYTVSSFKTYVSNNPEHSGIHNYYLMMTVEQGLPGLVFFLLFSFLTMIKGEQIYHQTKDPGRRRTLVAAILCFVLTDLLMLMNDFVETDKIGSLFFMSVAILVNIDLANSNDRRAEVA